MTSMAMVAVLLVAACWLATPSAAEAQVWKAIKQQATQKLQTRKAKADSALIARAAQTVDSTLAKSGRGLDTAVSVAAGFADKAVVKTEETVAHATAGLRGQNSESDKLAADLVAGRAVMPEIRFDGATDQLSAGSEAHIGHLAQTLKSQPGSFLIEVHIDASGDIAADKALSDRRATVIKSHLMTQGVPAERVFVMGLGATRPLTTPTSSNARIEVARIQ